MKRALILLLTLLLYRAPPLQEIPLNPPSTKGEGVYITINRVIDGDTLEATLPDGTVEKVRLLCVNTQESVHPDKKRNTEFGKETSDHVKELLKHNSGALSGFPPSSCVTSYRRTRPNLTSIYIWSGRATLPTTPPMDTRGSTTMSSRRRRNTLVSGSWASGVRGRGLGGREIECREEISHTDCER